MPSPSYLEEASHRCVSGVRSNFGVVHIMHPRLLHAPICLLIFHMHVFFPFFSHPLHILGFITHLPRQPYMCGDLWKRIDISPRDAVRYHDWTGRRCIIVSPKARTLSCEWLLQQRGIKVDYLRPTFGDSSNLDMLCFFRWLHITQFRSA